jgi:CHASE3 domain sensor protein/anti-anti-sigma regulatory factor
MVFFHNLRIRTKIVVCAILVLLIVVSMSGVVYNGITVSQVRDQEVAHTAEITGDIDALLLQIVNMETGYRGFLIVGDDAFLEPYTTGYQEYTHASTRLQELLHDDTPQLERLNKIDRAVQRWHNSVLETGIQVRRLINGSHDAAFTAFTTADSASKHAFEDLRTRVAELRAVETERSNTQRQEAQAAAAGLKTTLFVGSVLALLFSVGLLGLLATNIAHRVGQVTVAARQMAEGAHAVRCTLPAARDEVGQLADAFNTMVAIIERHTHDLRAQYAVADAARRDAEAAHAQIAEQLAVISEQQDLIREMSVPILPLTATTVVMPLVGALDSARLGVIHTQALQALEHAAVERLILDITGVLVVDTQVAQGLLQLIQMAKLMGATVIIVGIRPEVAQAIVGLGLDLAQIMTYSSLQQGMNSLLAANAAGRRS